MVQQVQKKVYKVRELNFIKKLLILWWIQSKKTLLDEFSIDANKIIYIRMASGVELTAPLSELDVKFRKDNNGYQWFDIRHGNTKVSFCDMMYLLPEEEWEEIKKILEHAPTARDSKWNIALSAIQNIRENVLGK